jgi:hypothetical protein
MATKRRSSRLPATRSDADPHKTDGFAVGVSQAHYWVITALAHAHNKPRVQIMEDIMNHYISCVLPKIPK